MKVIILRPSKTSMQSGFAKTRDWIMQFKEEQSNYIDPVMGWVGMRDARSEIRLRFKTLTQAIKYAQDQKYTYEVIEEANYKIVPKSYSDNFSNNHLR